MNRTLVVISFAVALSTLPAFAQTVAPLAGSGTALTPTQERLRRNPNATHEACVAEVDAKRLTGTVGRAAFQSCFNRQRQNCVKQAVAEGLPDGDETHDFVRDCLARGS